MLQTVWQKLRSRGMPLWAVHARPAPARVAGRQAARGPTAPPRRAVLPCYFVAAAATAAVALPVRGQDDGQSAGFIAQDAGFGATLAFATAADALPGHSGQLPVQPDARSFAQSAIDATVHVA